MIYRKTKEKVGSISIGYLVLFTGVILLFVLCFEFMTSYILKIGLQSVADTLSYSGIVMIDEEQSLSTGTPHIDEDRARERIMRLFEATYPNTGQLTSVYAPTISIDIINVDSSGIGRNPYYGIISNPSIVVEMEIKLKRGIFIKDGTPIRVISKSQVYLLEESEQAVKATPETLKERLKFENR